MNFKYSIIFLLALQTTKLVSDIEKVLHKAVRKGETVLSLKKELIETCKNVYFIYLEDTEALPICLKRLDQIQKKKVDFNDFGLTESKSVLEQKIDSIFTEEKENIAKDDLNQFLERILPLVNSQVKKSLYTDIIKTGQAMFNINENVFIQTLLARFKLTVSKENVDIKINESFNGHKVRKGYNAVMPGLTDYFKVRNNPHQELSEIALKIAYSYEEKLISKELKDRALERIKLIVLTIITLDKHTIVKDDESVLTWRSVLEDLIVNLLLHHNELSNNTDKSEEHLNWLRKTIKELMLLLPANQSLEFMSMYLRNLATDAELTPRYKKLLQIQFDDPDFSIGNDTNHMFMVFDYLIDRDISSFSEKLKNQLLNNFDSLLAFPSHLINSIDFSNTAINLIPVVVEKNLDFFKELQKETYGYRLGNGTRLKHDNFGQDFDEFLNELRNREDIENKTLILAYKLQNLKLNILDKIKVMDIHFEFDNEEKTMLKSLLDTNCAFFDDCRDLIVRMFVYDNPFQKINFYSDLDLYLDKINGKTFDTGRLLTNWDYPLNYKDYNKGVRASTAFSTNEPHFLNNSKKDMRATLVKRNDSLIFDTSMKSSRIVMELDEEYISRDNKTIQDMMNNSFSQIFDSNSVRRSIAMGYTRPSEIYMINRDIQRENFCEYSNEDCKQLMAAFKRLVNGDNFVFQVFGTLEPQFVQALRKGINFVQLYDNMLLVTLDDETEVELTFVKIINEQSPCYSEDKVKPLY